MFENPLRQRHGGRRVQTVGACKPLSQKKPHK